MRLGFRWGEGRAAGRHGEGLDVRLPVRRQLEELDAVPLCAVDVYCEQQIKQITHTF